VRPSGDDRNDRDLRLVQGSALDRLLSDKGLRSGMARELAKSDLEDDLGSKSAQSLQSPIHIVGEPKRHVRPPPLLVGHQHSRTRKVAPRSS
jgi:hypothetical protein